MTDNSKENNIETVKQSLSNKDVLKNIAVAAFISFWISSIGLAIFPSIARPPIWLIWGSSETRSTYYSYKPGQAGVTRNFFYVNNEGEIIPIHTLIAFLLTLSFYTVVFFILVNIRIYFIRRKYMKKE